MKKFILITIIFAGLKVSAGGSIGIKPIVNSPSCSGGANGTISLVVTGGIGPYTYSWNHSLPHTASQTGLAAGNYSVTVTDSHSATMTYSLTLAQPAALGLTTTAQNVSQNGGSNGCITLNVEGGTPDYSFHWSNNANVQSPCGLTAGDYTVTVIDAFGCSSTTSQEVYQPGQVIHSRQFHQIGGNFHVNAANGSSNGELRSDELGSSDNSNSATQTELTADDVIAYPNPAGNFVTVRVNSATNADLSLINTMGQTVLHIKTTTAETQLDLSGVAKGNYILSIKTESSAVNKMVSVIK